MCRILGCCLVLSLLPLRDRTRFMGMNRHRSYVPVSFKNKTHEEAEDKCIFKEQRTSSDIPDKLQLSEEHGVWVVAALDAGIMAK
ncbi:hypothetical protein BDN67DRAFT_1017984 [Paxillus ammoniavirescens]|nr:hypothetical protein BDN67DRAFT_1017984 [Paxillus ammoniavirescens]